MNFFYVNNFRCCFYHINREFVNIMTRQINRLVFQFKYFFNISEKIHLKIKYLHNKMC